ncbi:MAG: DUF2868 domain-containing protein [Pseudohongiellaceae bacterium]
MSGTTPTLHNKTTLTLSILGVFLGFFVSAGALSGDSQGRVNLLFLLLLFAFLPALSLVLSGFFAAFKFSGVTAAIIHSPIWPRQGQFLKPEFRTKKSQRFWFFFQSQVFSLAFAFGSVLIYLLLLLGTDINFVWRSTLLEATDLQPILKVIALPWYYWHEAQPTLALLEQSQNSRILGTASAYSENWWQFVLAAQISYNLLPRTLFLILANWKYRKEQKTEPGVSPIPKTSSASEKLDQHQPLLANVVYTLPSRYSLFDWGKAPEHCQKFVTRSFGKPLSINPLSPLDSLEPRTNAEAIVVLVKSWDAPLEELKDLLITTTGEAEKFILPLDWNESIVTEPLDSHLEEWQRFAATLSNWTVLQPGEHS